MHHFTLLVRAFLIVAIAVAVTDATGMAPSSFAASQPYTSLQPPYTQSVYGTIPAFMGGVAFAPNGDPWVDTCAFSGSGLYRFDSTTTGTISATAVHPSRFVPSNAGCGLTNNPNGHLYSNTSSGATELDANTGAYIRTLGPAGNVLGITTDPQTGHLVYVAADCRFTSTCTVVDLDPLTGNARNLAVLSSQDSQFLDGIAFDPSGRYLFMSNRYPVHRLTVLDRSGTIVQHVQMNSEPDGIAFHALAPQFVVTSNTDGTLTRFDFPGNDFTQMPTQSQFASGGFRGDLSQVGPDGCIYLSQAGTRHDDGTVGFENSLVRVCPGFAPPPGVQPFAGTFVLGDSTAAGALNTNTDVTWWGAQWATLNALSGGSAPSAFKGYASSTGSGLECGGTWTSGPGNSADPPSSVPPYMTVVASTNVRQVGSTLTGDIAHVYIVRTDTGYADNPGHAGTGSVVAQIC